MGTTSGLHSVLRRPASIRPPFSPWPEVMCFQADPSSGLVFYTIKELRDAGRLKLSSAQKAYIVGMEGTKGKQSFGRNANTCTAAFSRTATHVFRMVMLEACGVDPEHWPAGGESSYRNEDKLKYDQMYGGKFVLADSYEEAREYWCEFDKMYPHYIMEKFLEEKTGTLNNVMIIFKNYMQEMIEISMNVCAVHKSGKQINCCISATVVHRMIDLEGAGGPWLDRLALAVRGTRCPLLYHFDMLLDLDPATLAPADLDGQLSILYDSLPTTVANIDDTVENVNCHDQFSNVKEKKPDSFTDPASKRHNKEELEETTTCKTETKIRTTNPVTNEVVETKRVTTEKTVRSTKSAKGKTAEVDVTEEKVTEEKPKANKLKAEKAKTEAEKADQQGAKVNAGRAKAERERSKAAEKAEAERAEAERAEAERAEAERAEEERAETERAEAERVEAEQRKVKLEPAESLESNYEQD